jgi:Flp pilus assembly protein protease CpaA
MTILNSFDPIAKLLIVSGIVLLVSGALWHFGVLGALKIGRLPGDIVIERPNTKIYIPIMTCLLFSGILSLISLIFRK